MDAHPTAGAGGADVAAALDDSLDAAAEVLDAGSDDEAAADVLEDVAPDFVGAAVFAFLLPPQPARLTSVSTATIDAVRHPVLRRCLFPPWSTVVPSCVPARNQLELSARKTCSLRGRNVGATLPGVKSDVGPRAPGAPGDA
ncbi:MAG: hypothetical protein ABI912_11900 [Actinomycetota bacterium]